MIICTQEKLESWMPSLADAGIAIKPWTRMLYERIELCNSLEWTEWTHNPIQVQVCDACGTAGCGSGGYIHLSKVSDLVLWTSPQIDSGLELYPATALIRLGAIGFPAATWSEIVKASANIPELGMLDVANGRALMDAWAASPGLKAEKNSVVSLRRNLLAADTLETNAAIEKIEQWSDWLARRNQVAVGGRVLQVAEWGARVEKLYFDGPASDDWPALAEWHGSYYPLLSASQFFVPDIE